MKISPLTINFIITIFCFVFSSSVFAQPTLKEQNRIKDFGKSLKKYEKKNQKETSNKETSKDDETIRVETNLVTNDFLVVNQKGNLIAGLKKDDFIITENGEAQDIGLFAFGEDAKIPRSIVLIIDYSGNTRHITQNSIEAAKKMVDKLSSEDKMAIVTDGVKLLTDFTNDKNQLKTALDSLKNKKFLSSDGGRGDQYSALLAVLNELFDEETLRPMIIFQSSGGELFLLKPISNWFTKYYRERKFSFNDVREKVEKSRATIYSIIPGLSLLNVSAEVQEINIRKMLKITSEKVWDGRNVGKQFIEDNLKFHKIEMPANQKAASEIAQLSGGYTDFIEKPEDAETVYNTIFQTISNRYVIGYYPKNETKDGKRRTVKIEVKNHPEYIIMGRKSYFAPLGEK